MRGCAVWSARKRQREGAQRERERREGGGGSERELQSVERQSGRASERKGGEL